MEYYFDLDFKISKYSDLKTKAAMNLEFGVPVDPKKSQYKIKEEDFTVLEFIIQRHAEFDHCYGPNVINKAAGVKIIKDLQEVMEKLKVKSFSGKEIRQIIGFPEVYNYWDAQLEKHQAAIVNFMAGFIKILEANFKEHPTLTIWGI